MNLGSNLGSDDEHDHDEKLDRRGEPASAGQAVVTDEFDPTLSFRDAKERAISRWERWYVGQLMRHTRGNLSEAARVAHSDRSHLRKLVRRHLSPGARGTDPVAE